MTEIMKDGYWPISWVQPGATYTPHCHCDDETLYIGSGSIEFHHLTTREFHHLKSGDKLMLHSRTPHAARTDKGSTHIMGIRTLVPFEDQVIPIE